MRADCVGTTAVPQYERGVSHGCRVCFASTLHTCWLNGNASATVGLMPHIGKETMASLAGEARWAPARAVQRAGGTITLFPSVASRASWRTGGALPCALVGPPAAYATLSLP